ncbi:MAG: aminomethyl-transferring glycine dehydrogenase subunit GcvPB [candidate division WOR-3 bacterium]|nr:aminomethyl-transferring glycine dehydrogenase subunit GcvPB [candidate division WOR-3 bacterium]MCX7947421.1 aminomethyl-transferring glycine dehydrogenase subunit GcvPB [candidate division WOR-3 bacterium]MDW8151181.1 aminomethyl-transferring glycine dehydrogenase subunit GcvPB [candidate division WOR-3 bacterium]
MEKLSIELSNDSIGFSLNKLDVPEFNIEDKIPSKLLRKSKLNLPQLSENETFRHFLRLSQLNYNIDKNIYPLGSCTMKYNPKINEELARHPKFINLHPHTPDEFSQGALSIIYELSELLKEISGMDAVSLQPSAGSQGELTGILIISKYHNSKGEKRKIVLIPDSAHGTNPATATLAGLNSVEIKTVETGGILKAKSIKNEIDKYGENIAGLMITNPNTLGIFEEEIYEISNLLHKIDAQVYMDGANMNALVGNLKPSKFGIDVMHFNLHKTFSTPHGGGGPGSGAVAVKKHLAKFLPNPRVKKIDGKYKLVYEDQEYSIGRIHSFYGNFGMHIRALVYIRMLSSEGLKFISYLSVLNANYLRKRLEEIGYKVGFEKPSMHEFVLTLKDIKNKYGIKALDVAKRILDYGFHPPTIYFPLIVEEAFMIEPTDSESKSSLDSYIKAYENIMKEIKEEPSLLINAPVNTPIGRLDEAKAAKELKVKWQDID